VTDLVDDIALTPWPALTLGGWIVLLAAGAFVLTTARKWKGAGRRYRTDTPALATPPAASASAPLDAIDSWDGLSRGEDPTR
jgi:hypothetical protein